MTASKNGKNTKILAASENGKKHENTDRFRKWTKPKILTGKWTKRKYWSLQRKWINRKYWPLSKMEKTENTDSFRKNGKTENTDRFRKWKKLKILTASEKMQKPKILTAFENGKNRKYWPLPKMEKQKILTASENGKTENTNRFPVGAATEEQYAALGILLRLLGCGTVRVAVFRLRRPLLHYSPLWKIFESTVNSCRIPTAWTGFWNR
jgi:hypothetical protein